MRIELTRETLGLGAGAILALIGFAIVFFFPYNEDLLITGLLGGILGCTLLVAVGLSLIIKTRSESNRRIKEKYQMTLLDAVRLGIGMPRWWRWWYAVIAFVIIVVAVYSLTVVSPFLNFLIFFGYSGFWSLVVLLAARRELFKNKVEAQKRSSK